eukprot:CAMPEP_0119057110 /NCGR_PEP_ID=MMETSP1178-20130426/1635_1 /TAXON_ID=33656 /ORGANISM="unid sp, Strain CCMP2000" /LENGTH=54 /DNA_ID=CAMNT_0007037907 /DNA_START=122 /DNA_END=286 /DNA_ORIENTATION=+
MKSVALFVHSTHADAGCGGGDGGGGLGGGGEGVACGGDDGGELQQWPTPSATSP